MVFFADHHARTLSSNWTSRALPWRTLLFCLIFLLFTHQHQMLRQMSLLQKPCRSIFWCLGRQQYFFRRPGVDTSLEERHLPAIRRPRNSDLSLSSPNCFKVGSYNNSFCHLSRSRLLTMGMHSLSNRAGRKHLS